MFGMPTANTLLDVIEAAPGGSTAILLPEGGIRVTYESLREQVRGMANALASLGVRKGDRISTVLPNGLPAIVSFLAASMAGTAAPLNPGYREEEFRFYLEDTNAKLVLCPVEGAAEARRAAEGLGIPVRALEMDGEGSVRIVDAPDGETARAPSGRTSRSCCIQAAARGGRSAFRSGIATSRRRCATSWRIMR